MPLIVKFGSSHTTGIPGFEKSELIKVEIRFKSISSLAALTLKTVLPSFLSSKAKVG